MAKILNTIIEAAQKVVSVLSILGTLIDATEKALQAFLEGLKAEEPKA